MIEGLSVQNRKLLDSVYPVSRETLERLEKYRRLLLIWQAKTNLVAPATLTEFWSRHVADSLQIKALRPDAVCMVDLGSGGGFPGLVLAIANADSPDADHHLVESLNKKCAFLRAVAIETGSRCTVHCQRIESAAEQIARLPNPPQIVTARALAALPKLLDMAAPLLSTGAIALFHKGRDYLAEIEECRGLWRFDLVVHPSKIETGSAILEISNLARLGR